MRVRSECGKSTYRAVFFSKGMVFLVEVYQPRLACAIGTLSICGEWTIFNAFIYWPRCVHYYCTPSFLPVLNRYEPNTPSFTFYYIVITFLTQSSNVLTMSRTMAYRSFISNLLLFGLQYGIGV